MPTADTNTTWLLTKLRGIFQILADGIPLPDVPTLNFIASAVGVVGAVYDSVNNRINITLPLGTVNADPDTWVVRDGDGNIAGVNVTASGTVETDALVTSGAADIGAALRVVGGLGVHGTTPIAKGAVTGSRGGNAALASLLTYLATRGHLTDSTSA